MRRFLPVGLAALLIAASPVAAPNAPKAGTYDLAVAAGASGPGIDIVYALIKITPKEDGTVDGELVANSVQAPGLTVTGATLTADVLQIALEVRGTKLTFEGRVPRAGAEKLLGSFGDDSRISQASLTYTDKEKLGTADRIRRNPLPEQMEAATQLANRGNVLRMRERAAKDAEAKAKLAKEAAEVEEKAATEVPRLYREVVEKHGDNPVAADAAVALLRRAGKDKMPEAEAQKLANLCMTAAAARGPRYESDFRVQLAETLAANATLAPIAVNYATSAEKSLTAKSSTEQQVRVLKALAVAQKKAEQTAAAEATDARVAKLETILDNEYLAKTTPFKPETFAGRKEQSDRVVVMELFTGAQCPPCVAADLGFEGLEKTYKPTEVVLLQYHLHIPGPDPLTNPTTEARWAYYGKHFPEDMGGTPSTLFSGKPGAGGGGGIGNSEGKYREYRAIIDKQLETAAKATLTVDASRKGEQISIQAKVSNLPGPGEKVRLRFALVEESVRFAGGNKLRFHHMVVRTMPGGPEGFALTEKESQHTAKLSLADLRSELTKYLDETAEKRPYPKPDRPMAMKHLKVIAFVQDDETGDILQAAMADLGGEHAAK